MKKLRVIVETPYHKVGDIIECDDHYNYYDNVVNNGYLEWVEEDKSLKKKFIDILKGTKLYDPPIAPQDKLTNIAKEHYLEVFDKKRKELMKEGCLTTQDEHSRIRKAIENDERLI